MFWKQRCVEFRIWAVIAASVFIWLTASARAQSTQPAYRADRILIQPKAGINQAVLNNFHQARKSEVLRTFYGIGRLQVLHVPKGETVTSLIAQYQRSGLVEFAEPDYEIHAAAIPNDPKYTDGTLWGLNNTGQNGGTADADIDAPEGWDVLTAASNIVVAVVDSGINYTHEDLAANMWVSPVDGSHGWNAVATNNLPLDDNNHGSMVAGVLGAVGNNGKGVVGVAWSVQIMACKCLTSTNTGSDSDLIACIDYARTNGARIINASLDSPGYSQALSNAIVATRDAGIIFVASAGNGNPGVNIDVSPTYPACFQIDNIVTVAYTTRNDGLGGLSNYGETSVDLAAPGDEVYSTSSGLTSSYYPPFSFIKIAGTSFSAPCVSGALALMLAKFPTENYQQIIARLLNATDPLPSLAGKCVTGGRLNLHNALSPPIKLTVIPTASGAPFQMHLSGGPNRVCVIQVSTNLMSWMPVFTNTTSSSGVFDFADCQSTNSARSFYRATASP
ncbi:MAG: S8 family peptidase [Verrucomicrobiales bacterium]|nr:S8 family peptidase [Verrucomicrobiales bacterium]